VLAVLFLGPPIAFQGLVGVVTLAALYEFLRLAERTGHRVSKTVAGRRRRRRAPGLARLLGIRRSPPTAVG
jgi:hypothetical protein